MTIHSGLLVENLRHAYGKKIALDDVSFEVQQGQFCALLGPNGAGKSTLFSLLSRLFIANSGTIEIAGISLSKQSRLALGKMGIVFQQPTLDLDLSVQQNMLYYAALHGIGRRDAHKRIDESLTRLDMAERKHEKVRSLNGGHRRRMEIARALLHQPKVLLLDEPTVGLDAGSRKAITDHVHSLARDRDLTVLWATHLVDEVWPDDQLVVLHHGKVIENDTCKKVTGRKSLADTFANLTDGEAA